MVSIALQVESETTANSGNLQSPVSPPSDVEEVVKAEIKELRSLHPPAECNADLALNLQVAFPYLFSPEESGRTCSGFGPARCRSETASRWGLRCSPAVAGE
jgi:hypothetical protein